MRRDEMADITLKDRFAGCLLGLVIGDVLVGVLERSRVPITVERDGRKLPRVVADQDSTWVSKEARFPANRALTAPSNPG
jgi:hypothetical protein